MAPIGCGPEKGSCGGCARPFSVLARPMRSSTRVALFVASFALPMLCALPPLASASEFEQFRTPSGNIGCGYTGDSLRCDIHSGIPHPPPRPKNCDLDWGGGYAVSAHGPATVMCAGDTAIAMFTLALAGNATPLEAALIANHASAVVVGKLGTATVTRDELIASFEHDFD